MGMSNSISTTGTFLLFLFFIFNHIKSIATIQLNTIFSPSSETLKRSGLICMKNEFCSNVELEGIARIVQSLHISQFE